MTRHRIANIALVLGLAVALAASPLLDNNPARQQADHHAEWAQSTALADAQKAAQQAARQERAAAQLCARLRGNAGYRWTEGGELVCTDHRGRLAVAVGTPAGGAL